MAGTSRAFGAPLDRSSPFPGALPLAVSVCLSALESASKNKSANLDGLFRNAVPASQLRPAREIVERAHAECASKGEAWYRKRRGLDESAPLNPADLSGTALGDMWRAIHASDAHLPATLLKTFFRELPAPLLTFELFDPLVSCSSLPGDELVPSLPPLLGRLPAANLSVLSALVGTLRTLSHSGLTLRSLSVVWAPNVMYPRDAMRQVEHSHGIRAVVGAIIENWEEMGIPDHGPVTSPFPEIGTLHHAGAPTTPRRPSPLSLGLGPDPVNALLASTVSTLFSTSHSFSFGPDGPHIRGKVETANLPGLLAKQRERVARSFGPLSVADLRAWRNERADKRDRAVAASVRAAQEAAAACQRWLQQRLGGPKGGGSSSGGGDITLSDAERSELAPVYESLRSALSRYERDFQAALGRNPSPSDRLHSSLTSSFSLLSRCHAMLTPQPANPIVYTSGAYRGSMGRAHYNEVKSRNSERSETTAQEKVDPLAGSSSSMSSSLGHSGGRPGGLGEPSPMSPSMRAPHAMTSFGPDPLLTATRSLDRDRSLSGRPSDPRSMTLEQLRQEKHAIKKELKSYDAAFEAAHGRECAKADKECMRPLYKMYKELKDVIDRLEAGGSPRRNPRAQTARPAGNPSATHPERRPASARVHRDGDAEPQFSATATTSQPQGDLVRRREGAFTAGFDGGAGVVGMGLGGQSHQQQQQSGGGAGAAGINSAHYRELKREKRLLQNQLQAYQAEFVKAHGRKVKYRADRAPVEESYTRYKEVKAEIEAIEAGAK